MGKQLKCSFSILKETTLGQQRLTYNFVNLYFALLQKWGKFSFLPANFISNDLFSSKSICRLVVDFKKQYPQFKTDFLSHGLFFLPFLYPAESAEKDTAKWKWNLIILSRNHCIFGSTSSNTQNVLYMHLFNASDDAASPFRPSQRKLMR